MLSSLTWIHLNLPAVLGNHEFWDLFVLFLIQGLLCNPRNSQTSSATGGNLELLFLLTLPPKCWDYRHGLLFLFMCYWGAVWLDALRQASLPAEPHSQSHPPPNIWSNGLNVSSRHLDVPRPSQVFVQWCLLPVSNVLFKHQIHTSPLKPFIFFSGPFSPTVMTCNLL